LIVGIRAASVFSILCSYLLIRQVAVAVGLTSLGGQATMVRPLIAPMAEAAAEAKLGSIGGPLRERIRAEAAAAENVGLFFGEDIFVAIGSILLIKGFLEQNGVLVEPLQLSVWAIPTAIVAFAAHATRLLLVERRLYRSIGAPVHEKARA
jgi:uncharacterized membrane protein